MSSPRSRSPSSKVRLRELTALADLGRALAEAPLDLARLAETIYTQAAQLVETHFFQLGLFEEDSYRLLVWVSDGERRPPTEFRLTPASPGIVGWVRDSRQSLLVHDYESETLPAQPRYISPNPPRAGMFVPLLVREEVRGVMALQSRTPNAFSEEDLRLLSIVANQAAVAIENARLYEQASRRAAHLALVSEVARRVSVLQPLPALYKQVVTLTAETFSGYIVYFYVAEGEVLVLQAASGEVEAEGPPKQLQFGEGVVGEAALRRESLLRRELPELNEGDTLPPVHRLPIQLAVPVEIDGRILGVLDIHSTPGAVLDSSVQTVFKSLTDQIAIAILEAQVFEAEQRRAEHLDALAQASRVAASTLELEDLLDEMLDLLDEKFGYKSTRIFLAHDHQLVYHAGAGLGTVRRNFASLAYDLEGPGLIALVGRTRQPILVDDVEQHPDYVPGPELTTMRAELVAPLVIGGQLVGVLDLQADRVGAFTVEDARTVQTLADTLAVAVRNARLFEQERRRRHLAEVMREVSSAMTSTLNLDQVLELILDGLALVLDYDAASILLAEEGTGAVVLRAGRGIPGLGDMVGTALNIRLYPLGEAAPTLLSFDDEEAYHDYHTLVGLPDPHTCLAASLLPRGEHLGYLVVDRAGARHFQRNEIEFITTFASQAAVAIENARLYTAQREQAWISAALLQVAEATARATELEEVLDTVARLTPLLVGVDRCAVFLREEGQFNLKAQAGAGEEITLADWANRLPQGLHPTSCPRFGELLQTLEPVVLDVEDTLPEALRAVFNGVVILLPLLAKGAVEGILLVGQAPGATPFTMHRVRLMMGIANQAALAIESALLTLAQQEEAWVSTALLQVAEAVAGQALEVGLETVVYLTPMLVGLKKVAIYQRDLHTRLFYLRQAVGLDKAGVTVLRAMPLGLDDLGLAVDYRSLINRSGYLELTLPAQLATPSGLEKVWVWPLRGPAEMLGALVVEAVPLNQRRIAILSGIAHQLTMAFENARLAQEVVAQQRLEHELALGRDIQRSFLPHTYPEAPGWEIAAYWRAARQVGGDFYDFIPLNVSGERGPCWGIVIADVSDKGVPAALFMALSRTLLRSVAINRLSPAETLTRANELLMADVHTTQFVTVFYGVWEPAAGRLAYATAGHNPPLWYTAAGEIKTLPGRGSALGVFEDARYKEFEVQLNPGDGLVLYTDGLTDAINAAQEEFSLQRAINLLAKAYVCPAQTVLDMLASAVESHEGDVPAFDDLTLVVLRHAGQEGIRE